MKLDIESFKEYCSEFNIEKSFYDDLLELYYRATMFQFDHLQVIVNEHITHPEVPFKELINLLNLDDITGVESIYLVDIIDTKENKSVIKEDQVNLKLSDYESFDSGYKKLIIDIMEKELGRKTIYVSSEDVVELSGSELTFVKDNYKIKCRISTE